MRMKGKAAVFKSVGSAMEIREFPLPDVEPEGILVRVSLCNLCGSDLHMWRGEIPSGPTPTILGHEMVGSVYELGSRVNTDSAGQPLAVGDRVVYQYWKSCGRCVACLNGDTMACNSKYPFRTGRPVDESPHFIGGYAQYYYLVPGQTVFKVPDELPDEVVAPVNCALSQVLFGLSRAGVAPSDSVIIQGAGGLGLNSVAVAREMGAAQVIVIDRLEDRLKLAKSFGADHTISFNECPSPRERTSRVRELTGGKYADLVVEVTGVPEAITEGTGMIRYGGRYLIMGNITAGAMAQFQPMSMVVRSATWFFSAWYEPWAIVRSLDLLRRTSGKYPFDQILSHKFKLEEINQAFQQADKGKVIRATIVP